MNACSLCVFCGPSLPPEDRVVSPSVVYVPPASRGDVARAAERFGTVLIIDGVFHHDLAPTPREVYDALSRVRIFGASSMGALRAAECAPYGAVPLGAIAGWYVRELIDGDDEVAVLVDPDTQRALTVPSVNVRYVAALAVRRGLMERSAAAAWVDRARDVFYMDRTWERAIELAPLDLRDGLGEIAAKEGDLKRWDARFALRSVLRRLAV
jgi:hypothetical protein